MTHFFAGNLHAIDWACPVGTPLVAVGDGIVVESRDSNTLLSGIATTNLFEWNSIVLQLMDASSIDKDPLFVEYVHIQSSKVQPGEHVVRGQVIGTSGSVGFSPEPHLHFCAYRSADTTAPTVQVEFATTDGRRFLPVAGEWYDAEGVQDVGEARVP